MGEIIVFPCNQFDSQEPGGPAEIKAFVQKYGAQFKVMEKIDVNGPSTHPVYKLLKQNGGDIRWNFFSKFLVTCDAKVCRIGRFDNVLPKALVPFFVNWLPGSVEIAKPGDGVSFIFSMLLIGGALWLCVSCQSTVKKANASSMGDEDITAGDDDEGDDEDENPQHNSPATDEKNEKKEK